jgi:hypothetical protein
MVRFTNIKIQEGTIAESKNGFKSNVTGNYSWEFSPTRGITMWNGG